MKPFVSVLVIAGIGIVGLISLLYGSVYSIPDLVTVSYGFPLRWGVNTVVTIAGSVNRWEVNLMSLIIDLTVWIGLLVLASIYLIYRRT
jgi:hypothetical protein